jgi:hypothetical protein
MAAMSLIRVNLDDLMLLEQHRIERLCSFFAESLSHCIVVCDRHKTLRVHCSEAAVDIILSDLKDLCNYAWLILGVEAIVLYFAQEEICRAEICNIDQTPICRT